MESQKFRGMNIALWIIQAILAVIFLLEGYTKATTPMDMLVEQMPWAGDFPTLARVVGVLEMLGSVGLLVPALLRIPLVTAFAALGIFLIMILAFLFHLTRGEFDVIPFNLLFAAFTGFVAWGRFKKVPITARG